MACPEHLEACIRDQLRDCPTVAVSTMSGLSPKALSAATCSIEVFALAPREVAAVAVLVELAGGLEPPTTCLQDRCATGCATPADGAPRRRGQPRSLRGPALNGALV